ncbi:hypothetical protein [Herbiconiux sp.]|uniref:hypothetical protein n=1 Tax=Herbiconiux sp. TaxID=1871186 RepID=UPI0025BA2927|nr:hypothetical protein [Herbiconiux sp.]
MAIATATAVILGANALAPVQSASATPSELVYTMSTTGFPYDSGKARKQFTDLYGSTRVEDFIRSYTTANPAPGGTVPFTATGASWISRVADSGSTGTVTFEPYAITVRVKTDSIRAASWGEVMKTAGIVAATAATSALAFYGCIAAAVSLTGGVASITCKAVAGAMAALVARVLQAHFNNEDMKSGQFWAETFVAMLMGALAGAALDWASTFTKNSVPTMLIRVADTWDRFVAWLGSWATPWIRESVPRFRILMRDAGDKLVGAWERAMRPLACPACGAPNG